jgi:hypothetical protein
VVGVESRGEWGLGSERESPMDDRRRAEDEALHDVHLGGQSGAHGSLMLQGEGRGALALLRGGLDGGDGGDQRGVGGGRRGSPSGVGEEWANGLEVDRRDGARFHGGGESARACRVPREKASSTRAGCRGGGEAGSGRATGMGPRDGAVRSGGRANLARCASALGMGRRIWVAGGAGVDGEEEAVVGGGGGSCGQEVLGQRRLGRERPGTPAAGGGAAGAAAGGGGAGREKWKTNLPLILCGKP